MVSFSLNPQNPIPFSSLSFHLSHSPIRTISYPLFVIESITTICQKSITSLPRPLKPTSQAMHEQEESSSGWLVGWWLLWWVWWLIDGFGDWLMGWIIVLVIDRWQGWWLVVWFVHVDFKLQGWLVDWFRCWCGF